MNQRTRVTVAAVVIALLIASLGVQAVVIEREHRVVNDDGRYPGNTLVGVHSYDETGRIVELTPDGEVAWEWSVPESRVFGVEQLDEETVLAAVAVKRLAEDCDEEYLEYEEKDGHCVRNRVVEIDKESGEVVWEYDWYDEFIAWHEVHDVERLENGETAIVDMGNDRAFTVDRDGEITWEWHAEDHLTPGTPFYEEYGGPEREGEHDDWTHMNDIDRLENGNFQLSIRNFDVIIEVDPETDEVVDVVGEPGNHDVLDKQHNPHRIEDQGTMVVADSENGRIVELDVESEERIWRYTGPATDPLQWPRDADRLPNGNTLITDSRNNRVLEVDPDGEIVWQFGDPDGTVIPLAYEADRIGAGEQSDVPPGSELTAVEDEPGAITATIREWEAMAQYVFPTWMHLPQILHVVGIAFGVLWLCAEGVVFGWRRLTGSR
ncbi:aryl-sulfate sulfotransferase [Haloterrigena salifodinae]|uniref:Aryl-sulfate sulfotransferase n=1 Tax=Haloterrigena salifodinae TaxID=2675099 RepID=A0A8T8DWT8_9EURY|nr:aryl-sulfate sulfotransferase [Haloterrigena salifodinae]QRV13827.1 aryl-sulfate sulfotransferase [Haloterrigena salifodinae]